MQYIRACSTLQSLLGNIGRPGGGILALPGHASSTDSPTLFDLLPGCLPIPHALHHLNLAAASWPNRAPPQWLREINGTGPDGAARRCRRTCS